MHNAKTKRNFRQNFHLFYSEFFLLNFLFILREIFKFLSEMPKKDRTFSRKKNVSRNDFHFSLETNENRMYIIVEFTRKKSVKRPFCCTDSILQVYLTHIYAI